MYTYKYFFKNVNQGGEGLTLRNSYTISCIKMLLCGKAYILSINITILDKKNITSV